MVLHILPGENMLIMASRYTHIIQQNNSPPSHCILRLVYTPDFISPPLVHIYLQVYSLSRISLVNQLII